MEDTERLRRRYNIMLIIGLLFLAGSIVLFFRLGSGLSRWLGVLTWLSITMVYWELRRALPPKP